MVTILFFAELREQLACERINLEVSAPITLAQVREQLVAEHPHWAAFLRSDKLLCAHNQALTKASQLVSDGDEIAFFPPVTGG